MTLNFVHIKLCIDLHSIAISYRWTLVVLLLKMFDVLHHYKYCYYIIKSFWFDTKYKVNLTNQTYCIFGKRKRKNSHF